MRGIVVLSIVAIFLTSAVPAIGQATAVDFSGRVIDASTKRGIENLEVKLTPPRGVRAPIRVASTDVNGGFLFAKLARGRYLVEVSQGVNTLYRAEVDVARMNRLDVPLQRRR